MLWEESYIKKFRMINLRYKNYSNKEWWKVNQGKFFHIIYLFIYLFFLKKFFLILFYF